MDEVFIYIGSQQNAHFFMHTVVDEEKYAAETGAQIYNCMISETIFREPGQIVIVFDIHEEGKIDVVVTQHVKNENMLRYDKHDLSAQFKRLLRANRGTHKILTFVHKPEIDAFLTNELSTDQLPNLQNGVTNIDRTTFVINSVEYMMTKKSFSS